ncbi:CLUMA_CG005602, isoform A [Clunio marinus]|uniref:CLUMA_CG005602, isoform A n=1 Tax=Clunio marinus TaxID=568069 RepID=A0A1J1HZQ2_9DIPT|nr:CLUMA_CG005602, isoform A [Clunio marinus]
MTMIWGWNTGTSDIVKKAYFPSNAPSFLVPADRQKQRKGTETKRLELKSFLRFLERFSPRGVFGLLEVNFCYRLEFSSTTAQEKHLTESRELEENDHEREWQNLLRALSGRLGIWNTIMIMWLLSNIEAIKLMTTLTMTMQKVKAKTETSNGIDGSVGQVNGESLVEARSLYYFKAFISRIQCYANFNGLSWILVVTLLCTKRDESSHFSVG